LKSAAFPQPVGEESRKIGKFPAIIQNFQFPTPFAGYGNLWKRWADGYLRRSETGGMWKRQSTVICGFPQGKIGENEGFCGLGVEIREVSHSICGDFPGVFNNLWKTVWET